MSQLLDNTKKMTKIEKKKSRKKKSKNVFFWSELSDTNSELTSRLHQEIDKKSRKKNRKIIVLNIDIYPIYFY